MITIFVSLFFFFNHPATTEIYTLSLHDALPIFHDPVEAGVVVEFFADIGQEVADGGRGLVTIEFDHERAFVGRDRKSTRLNSSHSQISYAVFCLKKKKK